MTQARPLRILQIARAPAGGIRKHLFSLAKMVHPQQVKFFLATDLSKADLSYKNNQDSLRCKIFDVQIPYNPGLKDISVVYKLWKHYRNQEIDIIHGHGAKGGIYARLLGLFLNAKVVYTAHGGSIHVTHGRVKNVLYSLIEKFLYLITDRIIFESLYTKEAYEGRIWSARKKGLLIYNGIDLSGEHQPKDLNQRILIGTFGELRKLKGHDILIKAISLLREKGRNIHLLISGSGEEEHTWRTLITKLDLVEHVTLETNTTDVEATMKTCDLIVQPSLFESFGYVPLEAMSLGIPVIGSAVGGMLETIQDQQTGLLVYSLTPEGFSSAIETLVDDSELRNNLVQNAYKQLRSNFSEDKMVTETKELYHSLL